MAGWDNPNNPGNNTPITSEQNVAANSLGISSLLVDALGGQDPNLQAAWQAFLKNDMTEFERLVRASNFYTKNNGTARQRIKAKSDQPGVYQSELSGYIASTKKRLVKAGIKLSDADLTEYATKAFDAGMDDNQVDEMLITANKALTITGGETGGDIQSLKQYANSFGVGTLQNWDATGAALFAGNTTVEEIQAKIRQDAISAYPAYAPGFEKGITLDAQASAIKSTYAAVMEVDPDTVSFQNPALQKALQYKNAKGEPEAMPTWLASQEFKKLPGWDLTNNARDTLDSKTTRIFSDMGLI